MATITWDFSSITGDTSSISQANLSTIQELIIEAGNFWSRYLAPARDVTLSIDLNFEEFPGNTLATGGTTFFGTGISSQGFRIGTPITLLELETGFDVNGADGDLFINIDLSSLNFAFFDPDPTARTANVPFNRLDYVSLFIHEIGHALGFASFRNSDGNIPDGFGSTFDLSLIHI